MTCAIQHAEMAYTGCRHVGGRDPGQRSAETRKAAPDVIGKTRVLRTSCARGPARDIKAISNRPTGLSYLIPAHLLPRPVGSQTLLALFRSYSRIYIMAALLSSANSSRRPSPLRPGGSHYDPVTPMDDEVHPVIHDGRVAVITGAANGIGRAAAVELAKCVPFSHPKLPPETDATRMCAGSGSRSR